MTFFEGAQLLTVRFVPSFYHHISFALHKLSFACVKTKFSPVGDGILDCQCQCQRIVKFYPSNSSLC